MRSRSFSSLLIALLVGASLPAWSVQGSMKRTPSLACVHACAVGDAWVTQGGRLPALAPNRGCSVRSRAGSPAIQTPAPRMVLPGSTLAPALPAPLLPPAGLAWGPRSSRGPPRYGGFLGSQHPFAQAPPTLL